MFKINRKDTRTISSDVPPVSLISLWMDVTPYSIDCFEGFEQVNTQWVSILFQSFCENSN